MPKGDPAGYLPRVKRARKRAGGGSPFNRGPGDSRFNPFRGDTERRGEYVPRSQRKPKSEGAAERIRSGGGSHPAEDSPDFVPKRHGNRKGRY